jgi:hypothetical protein
LVFVSSFIIIIHNNNNNNNNHINNARMGSSSSPNNSSNHAASGMTTTPQFRVGTATTSPEFVAVILAATHGANLFPLTGPPCFSSSSSSSNAAETASSSTHAAVPLSSLPPKHLLPLAGVSLLQRLITCVQQCGGFSDVVVCIAHDDHVTIPSLLLQGESKWKVVVDSASESGVKNDATMASPPVVILQPAESVIWNHHQLQQPSPRLVLVRLPLGTSDSGGSVDALRHVEATRVISKHSHVAVFPSDLVILNGTSSIQQLVQAHRQRQERQVEQQESASTDSSRIHNNNKVFSPSAACTVLLADVGEVDENGIPLKESAKQKKGGLAREDEAIEYTALAYDNNDCKNTAATTPRLIWKQSKFDVESDEHFTGDTPKLVLPKPRLRLGRSSGNGTTTTVKVQTNWNDLHVYILSPWVRRLITSRTSLLSIQNDLIPLLIARQTKGICATLGSKMDQTKVHDIFRNNDDTSHHHEDDDSAHSSHTHPHPHPIPSVQGKVPRTTSSSSSEKQGCDVGARVPHWLTSEYAVLAHVIPGAAAVRASSIPAFLHASKELVSQVIAASGGANPAPLSSSSSRAISANPCLFVPLNSTIRAKSQSVILPETTHDMLGDKLTFKSTIVGRYCKLGNKCRLNNVVLFDNVTLGDNCIIQNTIVGPGAVIGDNCSLNDCQVAPGKVVAAGTKHKGEALLLDDDH